MLRIFLKGVMMASRAKKALGFAGAVIAALLLGALAYAAGGFFDAKRQAPILAARADKLLAIYL